jgi:AP2 domain
MEEVSTPPQENEKKRPRRQRNTPRTKQLQQRLLDLSDVPPLEPLRKGDATRRFADNSRARPTSKAARVSQYVGVYWDVIQQKWRAQMMIQGVIQNLGCYDNEREAGIVYAKAAFKYKPSAPPPGVYGGMDLRTVPEQLLTLQEPGRKCRYKGVKQNKKRWEARVSIPGKGTQSLGTFDTEEEAAQVHAKARYFLEINAAESETTRVASNIVEETVNAVFRTKQEKEDETAQTVDQEIVEEAENTVAEEQQGRGVRATNKVAVKEESRIKEEDDEGCIVLFHDDDDPSGENIEYIAAV